MQRRNTAPSRGLDYLSTEDASDWSNVYMALYYGFDSIIGY